MGCARSRSEVDFYVQDEFQPTAVMPEDGSSGTESMFHRQYIIGKKLGMGAFAQVYTVTQVNPDKVSTDKAAGEYAAKVIDLRTCVKGKRVNKVDHKARKAAAHEFEILRLVGMWGACVQLVEAFLTGGPCAYIVMEKCDGSLPECLKSAEAVTERTVVGVLRQALQAIRFIQVVGVIHRDIKPTNFLVKGGAVKLSDFGMAERLGPRMPVLEGKAGTAPYMSPEMVCGEAYDAKTDVWSMGVMAYVLLLGKFPYTTPRRSSRAMRAAVREGMPPPNFEPQEGLPPVSTAATQFLRTVLVRNPKQRPSAMDALAAFSNIEQEASEESEEWGTASLRPTLQAAERVGAFGAPESEAKPTSLDKHLRRLQAKNHGTSAGTRRTGWWRRRGSRVVAADISTASAP